MAAPPPPPLTPELRTWLQREQAWGRRALDAIAKQRRLLLNDSHGLDRFRIRMALVEITGSVARWTKRLHDGLAGHAHAEAAASFAVIPPFAEANPSTADCDRLDEYIEDRMHLLQGLLAEDRA